MDFLAKGYHTDEIRERPKCRTVIEKMLTEYNCNLETLWIEHYCELSTGLRKQAKLMMLELKNQGGD